MQTVRQIVRVASLRYDADAGAFEGRVDVERDGQTYRYPARLGAPASAPRDWVEAELAAAALRQSDTPRFDGRAPKAPARAPLQAWFPWVRPAAQRPGRPRAS